MKTVNFLYGKTTLDLEVPDDTPVLTSNIDELHSNKSGYDIVAEAMENPIDSPRLFELAKANRTVQLLSVTTHALYQVRTFYLI